MNAVLKGLLTSLIVLILIGATNLSFAEQTMFASGDGVFTHSERLTKNVQRRVNRGCFRSLDKLVYTGLAMFPPQGTPVKVQSYRKGIYRVKIPGNQAEWYVSEEGLMNRASPSFGGRGKRGGKWGR